MAVWDNIRVGMAPFEMAAAGIQPRQFSYLQENRLVRFEPKIPPMTKRRTEDFAAEVWR